MGTVHCKDAFDRDFPLEDAKACVGKGWGDIVERCYKACLTHNVAIFQVKEKFGSLRFYVGSAPDEVHDVIERAEKESETTCEECGAKGKIKADDGWLRCLCNNCRENRNKPE